MKNILFMDQQHEAFYKDMIKEFTDRNGGRAPDVYQEAMAYTLGLTEETRQHAGSIFNLKENGIEPSSLIAPWQTSTTRKVTRLAFNLWNGFTGKVESDESEEEGYRIGETDPAFAVDNIFCSSLGRYFFEAIKLRYPEYNREEYGRR